MICGRSKPTSASSASPSAPLCSRDCPLVFGGQVHHEGIARRLTLRYPQSPSHLAREISGQVKAQPIPSPLARSTTVALVIRSKDPFDLRQSDPLPLILDLDPYPMIPLPPGSDKHLLAWRRQRQCVLNQADEHQLNLPLIPLGELSSGMDLEADSIWTLSKPPLHDLGHLGDAEGTLRHRKRPVRHLCGR